MKIGIVTIYGNENYGNKFQNYAIIKMIKNINKESEVYTIIPKYGFKQSIYRLFIKLGIGKFKLDEFDKSRRYKFEVFSQENIHIYKYKNLKQLNSTFDLFFAGSDQIWNTDGFTNKILDFYLLGFADSKKRIAIAPSLGDSTIKGDQLKYFKKELPKFDKLSCRELQSIELLEKYSNGKTCIKLPDPTLGLSIDEWNTIRKTANKKPTKEYAFCYLLGKVDDGLKEVIHSLCHQMDIVQIMDKKDIELYSNDPGQFIDLLDDSQLVLTDSFHGCVFSLIYNKPFIVLHTKDRMKMEDRLKSLLKEFDLESRWIENIDYNNIYNIDFNLVNKKLKDESKIINQYIQEAIEK